MHKARDVAGAALLAALAPFGSGFAAPVWTGSADHQRCIAKAAGADADAADCANAEFEREDKRLTGLCARRLGAANATVREAVRRSQRAWLAFRDASCEAEGASFSGGTFERVAVAECRSRFAAERADWLDTLAE